MPETTPSEETARHINIRVASRVMRWAQWDDLAEDCPCEPGVTYFADWGETGGLSVYLPEEGGDPSFRFDPAENIADAWKAVEKMRGGGWMVRVQEMPDGLPYLAGSGWRPEENQPIRRRAACWLYPSPELVAKMVGVYLTAVCEFADTAPLAICKATLKAAEASA